MIGFLQDSWIWFAIGYPLVGAWFAGLSGSDDAGDVWAAVIAWPLVLALAAGILVRRALS